MSQDSRPGHAGYMSRPSLAELARVYAKIGLLGFGGGYAVLAFIHDEVVDRRRWLNAQQFDHLVEMSSFAPGATTVNVMAAIAYRLHGWRGLVLGTLAVLWPSFLLVAALARVTTVLHVAWVEGALRGVEVAVIGLLADVVFTLSREIPRVPVTIAMAVGAGILVLAGLNPALVLLFVALAGLLDYLIRRKPLPEGMGGGGIGRQASADRP
jgi:chromate transporter